MTADPLRRWWCDGRVAEMTVGAAFADALALDVETSGLRAGRDRITEIAVVRVADGAVAYRWTTRRDRGTPAVAADAAREAVGESPVVIHNAMFDLLFLRTASDAWRGAAVPRWLCTWRAFGAGPSLDALATRAGVRVTGRHTAIGDAGALAAIVRRAWDGSRRDAIANVAAWTPPLRPQSTTATTIADAFPLKVPLRVPSAAQRNALAVLHETLASEVVDPVAAADAVTAALHAGVVRGHVEPLAHGRYRAGA